MACLRGYCLSLLFKDYSSVDCPYYLFNDAINGNALSILIWDPSLAMHCTCPVTF